jgi:hypothetical protein
MQIIVAERRQVSIAGMRRGKKTHKTERRTAFALLRRGKSARQGVENRVNAELRTRIFPRRLVSFAIFAVELLRSETGRMPVPRPTVSSL